MARPTEVKAITALLEAEHPDVEALAKAVIEKLDELRESRPHYTVVLSWGDRERFAVGVYPDAQTAFYAARRIAPGTPDEALKRAVHQIKPNDWWTPVEEPTLKGTCPQCGHPTYCHNWPKYRKKITGCIVSLKPKGEVGANLCPCEGDGKS